MSFITDYVRASYIYYVQTHLVAFFNTIQLVSYWLSLQTTTILHPIKLSLSTCFSLSSHYSSHPLPPAHSHWRRQHTKGKYEICKAYYLPNKTVIKSMFKILNLDLVESNMLYIDIFITKIYIFISESFIDLIRLLQIILKMSGIRVRGTWGSQICWNFVTISYCF